MAHKLAAGFAIVNWILILLDAGFYLTLPQQIALSGWSALFAPALSTLTLLGGGLLMFQKKPLGGILLSIGLSWRCVNVGTVLEGRLLDRSIALSAQQSGYDIDVPSLTGITFGSTLLLGLLAALITVVFFRQRRD